MDIKCDTGYCYKSLIANREQLDRNLGTKIAGPLGLAERFNFKSGLLILYLYTWFMYMYWVPIVINQSRSLSFYYHCSYNIFTGGEPHRSDLQVLVSTPFNKAGLNSFSPNPRELGL